MNEKLLLSVQLYQTPECWGLKKDLVSDSTLKFYVAPIHALTATEVTNGITLPKGTGGGIWSIQPNTQ